MSKKFGVMIACYAGDMHYAQASYMSVRHFLGKEMPICFVVDGDSTLLEKMLSDPHVQALTKKNINTKYFSGNNFGWGYSKVIASWDVPFENYLFLDADALVWGDVVKEYYTPEFDFIIDQQKEYSDEEISHWFFSTEKIPDHYPDFDYTSFRNRFACTGTFFARKGCLNFEQWNKAAQIQKNESGVFPFGGEMGPLNFLWAYGVQQNTLTIKSTTYQIIPVDHTEEELEKYYSPKALDSDHIKAAVLHFCGKKPHIFSASPKVSAMNYFRVRYLLEKENLSLPKAVCRMALQDFRFITIPWLKRGVRKVKRILREKLGVRRNNN